MTDHKGLPVSGYRQQSQRNVDLVNQNKEIEERVLRQIDKHAHPAMLRSVPEFDQRMVALARTKTQEAFMWLNRAVFQPDRVSLPDDAAKDDGPSAA